MTELSVLFVNYNSWRVCVGALRSLLDQPPRRQDGRSLRFEVVVVDNCSPERDPEAEAELAELLARIDGRLVMHDENGGYSKGMNLAYRHSRGELVLVSNPDVLFKPGCIDQLVRAIEADPGIGAAAPEGYWDEGLDGRLPPNILPTIGDLLALTAGDLSPRFVRRYSRKRTRDALRVWESRGDVDLAMLSGCCFLMRRSFIEQIGFFDERFPLYYEDTDLSVRIVRAGKRIVQVHGAHLVHLYNRSGQTDHGLAMERYWKSRRLYYRKWYGPLGGVVYDFTRKVLGSAWAKRRAARPPHAIRDLGVDHYKPVIELDRSYDRYLVEFALDPRFYLAGGTFGSGSRWTPSNSMFKGFGPTTYYFRLVDLTRPDLPQIGVWSYTLAYPAKFAERPVAAPAEVAPVACPVQGGKGSP